MRAEQPRSSRVVRFGVFEADLSAGELRKNGLKIKLQDHPFRLLAFLLERPGEVVTREELRQRLWSADTFVEFDHSVNTAIRKIREALDDSSNNPRFVETLPRRGYRFIAPVDGDQPVAAIALPPTKRLWLRAGSVVAVAIVAATTGWLALRKDTPDTAPFKVAPLTTYPGVEAHPSFSPDGSEVAFAWGRDYSSNYDIYVKQIGVDQPSQLTDHPAQNSAPRGHPRGLTLLFFGVGHLTQVTPYCGWPLAAPGKACRSRFQPAMAMARANDRPETQRAQLPADRRLAPQGAFWVSVLASMDRPNHNA